jgi:hypothetical protein
MTMSADAHALTNLEVYDTKAGLWHPELGDLVAPDGWELLPAGDAFLTRRVSAGGVYWIVWRPKGRRAAHRRKVGLLAPRGAIDAARAAAADTVSERAKQRDANARQRDRAEAVYREELAAAVFRWLDFASPHSLLATEISVGAVEQAAVVGSGRVGRTRTLPIEERAALAARAFIRHHHTEYDEWLSELDPLAVEMDGAEYRRVKRNAHRAVDLFLDAHRRPAR